VDLARFHLSSAALVVARALKRYGAIIGDQTRGKINLKVENTVAEGEGWGWRGVLGHRSLSNIPLRSFQVIRLGYRGRRTPSPLNGTASTASRRVGRSRPRSPRMRRT